MRDGSVDAREERLELRLRRREHVGDRQRLERQRRGVEVRLRHHLDPSVEHDGLHLRIRRVVHQRRRSRVRSLERRRRHRGRHRGHTTTGRGRSRRQRRVSSAPPGLGRPGGRPGGRPRSRRRLLSLGGVAFRRRRRQPPPPPGPPRSRPHRRHPHASSSPPARRRRRRFRRRSAVSRSVPRCPAARPPTPPPPRRRVREIELRVRVRERHVTRGGVTAVHGSVAREVRAAFLAFQVGARRERQTRHLLAADSAPTRRLGGARSDVSVTDVSVTDVSVTDVSTPRITAAAALTDVSTPRITAAAALTDVSTPRITAAAALTATGSLRVAIGRLGGVDGFPRASRRSLERGLRREGIRLSDGAKLTRDCRIDGPERVRQQTVPIESSGRVLVQETRDEVFKLGRDGGLFCRRREAGRR